VAALRLDLDLGPGMDAAELEDAAVEAVERVSAGGASVGSRAIEVAALGSFVIMFGQAAVGRLAGVRQGLPARRSGRTVKLTPSAGSIEISGGSASYRCQMIETFHAAHAKE
jgi:hypothetical protein